MQKDNITAFRHNNRQKDNLAIKRQFLNFLPLKKLVEPSPNPTNPRSKPRRHPNLLTALLHAPRPN
jgi:hypothetical protein